MKTSKFFYVKGTLVLLFAVAIIVGAIKASTTMATTSTPTPAPITTTPVVTPTPDSVSITTQPIPETIEYHGHSLVKEDIPSWLPLENHDENCCEYPEGELTRAILAHLTEDASEAFTINEVKNRECFEFAFYDPSMNRLKVGNTESELDEPTIDIGELKGELKLEEMDFGCVLSIIDEIKQSPTPTSFWTTDYDHFVTIEIVNGIEQLFIDGVFISVIPDRYPVSYEDALADWQKSESGLGYNYYNGHSRTEVMCDSEGKFFVVEDNCQIYTWQFDGIHPWYEMWWEPTNEYPILNSKNVIHSEGTYCSSWYFRTTNNRVDVFESFNGNDSCWFGFFEEFSIEFKEATIVQGFVSDETSYFAVPETNRIWRISVSESDFRVAEISYIDVDQIEVVNGAIYLREGDCLTQIAYSDSSDTWETTSSAVILEETDFRKMTETCLWSWWFDPNMTTKSKDGFMVIESDDIEITIK